MKKKALIFIGILLLAIGFATITTTMIINGNTTIAENENDYQIYFSGATIDKEDYTNEIISKDKKTITFETKILKNENDTSTLEYEVTNMSTMYDASAKINVKVADKDTIEVTNTFDETKKLSARETRSGTLEIKLKHGAIEEKKIPITIELIFDAEERDTIDTTPINEKVYSISGYFVDKEGNVLPNANIAVFSDKAQFVKTDDYGYFYVGNLERGKHELYYIDKSDVNKTHEEIKNNAIDTVNVTTTHSGKIDFNEGHEIKENIIREENNKTFKITLVKNNGEADEEIEVTENNLYITLPTPSKHGSKFLYWKDENGKIITTNTFVTEARSYKLYAYYGENTYTIAYNLNGGSLVNKVEETKYDKDITLETPIKTLKVFISDNNQGSTISENEISKMLTFKGWTGENLSSSALANGSSWNGSLIKTNTFKNLSDEQDKTVTLIANFEDINVTLPSVEKAGYTCILKDKDGSYKPGLSITLDGNGENREFVVECGTNTYTISYNSNGGSGSMDTTMCTYDKDCELSKNTFTRVGYTFDHWELNSSTFNDQATVKNLTESGNIELKAIWKANTYKIAYELNGGTSSNTPTGATFDKNVEISNPTRTITVTIDANKEGATLVKNNYTGATSFTGWTGKNLSNTALVNGSSWNGSLTKGTTFKNLTSILNETVTLTANYDKTNIALDVPTKTGYTCGYTDTSAGSIKYTTNITVSNDQTIYVKCNPNTYTITFDTDGGTTVTSKTATYDSKIGTLTTPTKTGYNFAGWYLDTESITSESVYKYAKDITLKAKWTEATNTKYTVNYYLQTLDKKYDKVTESIVYTGATNKTVDAELKTYEGFVTPTKQTVKILADGSAKVDYYYVRKELTVTFVSGDTKKEVSYLYGKDNQTFTDNGFTKTGYTLTGYSNTSGGSKNYEVTNTVTGTFIDANYPSKTVYAVFTANTYKIIFDNNGGSGTMDTITCTYDKDCVLKANTFTKTGYTFAGWSKTNEGSIEYTNNATVKNLATSGNITLYAKWSANTYTITYNANGGSGSMEKTTCTYDTDCTIAGNSFTKVGYTFAYWTGNPRPDASLITSIPAGTTVKNLATSGSITLYADWTANTYKIAYTLNNGTLGANKPKSAIYDANVLIDNPTKTLTVDIDENSQGATISKTSITQAQTFNGWTATGLNTNTAKTGTASNAITTSYTGASTKNTYFKNLTSTNDGTVTFTANWDNTAVTLPTVTKTGYTCGFAETTTGAIKYASGSKYTPSGETSKTLYAKCNPNTYTITYNANDGFGSMEKTTCVYDTDCTIAANNFIKVGYTFTNWTKDSTSGTAYNAGTTVKNLATSGNVNMYAKWNINTYNVTITNTAGGTTSTTDLKIDYNGSNDITLTPEYLYYTKSVTCSNGYKVEGLSTGKTSTSAQTIKIKNDGYAGDGTCEIEYYDACPEEEQKVVVDGKNKWIDRDCSNDRSIGDEYCYSDQCFNIYKIDEENSTYKMISKYNLYAGGSYNGTKFSPYSSPTYLQKDNMLGYAGETPYNGVTAYAKSSLKDQTQYEKSTVKTYVDKYATKMKNLGLSVTANDFDLITSQEIYDLLNDGNPITKLYSVAKKRRYQWIYSTTYWTKTPQSTEETGGLGNIMLRVTSSGNLTDLGCTDNRHNGVRPVVTLPQTVVPKLSFATDSWSTIQKVVQSGKTNVYNVGDTKEVDLGDLGTHTVRISNKSECTTETSETACGFVIEFADIIIKQAFINAFNAPNVGDWKNSTMRTYVNETVYNALPSDLQSVITSTKVISGHGNTAGETNFETQDKLYLLNAQEVWGNYNYDASYDTSVGTSKQLDYYKNQGITTSNYEAVIKQYNGSNDWWWLRSANSKDTGTFIAISNNGNLNSLNAYYSNGVSPAFRIA